MDESISIKKRKINSLDGDVGAIFTDMGTFIYGTDPVSKNSKILGFIETEDLQKYFQIPQELNTGILSPGTIYYEQFSHQNVGYYIIGVQKPPGEILYQNPSQKINQKLWLPYLQMFVLIRDNKTIRCNVAAYITCTNESLVDNKQEIFIPPLGNIEQDGRICFGNAVPPSDLSSKSISEVAKILLAHFLTSSFNETIPVYWPKNFSTFKEWFTDYTDPESVYNIAYCKNKYKTMDKLIEGIKLNVTKSNK
jgi:hypothetical protein